MYMLICVICQTLCPSRQVDLVAKFRHRFPPTVVTIDIRAFKVRYATLANESSVNFHSL